MAQKAENAWIDDLADLNISDNSDKEEAEMEQEG